MSGLNRMTQGKAIKLFRAFKRGRAVISRGRLYAPCVCHRDAPTSSSEQAELSQLGLARQIKNNVAYCSVSITAMPYWLMSVPRSLFFVSLKPSGAMPGLPTQYSKS